MKLKKMFFISFILAIFVVVVVIIIILIINKSESFQKNIDPNQKREISVRFKKEAKFSQIMEVLESKNFPIEFISLSAIVPISPDKTETVIQNIKKNKNVYEVTFDKSTNEISVDFSNNIDQSMATQIISQESLTVEHFTIPFVVFYNIPESKAKNFVDEFKKIPIVDSVYIHPLLVEL